MPSAFVLIGPDLRLDRDGLSTPAPVTVEGALSRCRKWAAEVGWTLAMEPRGADALVIGPGVAAPPVETPVVQVPRAQGIDGFRWALRHLAFTAQWPVEVAAYGPAPDHVADLRRPVEPTARGTAVLLHGGFWSGAWGRDLMDGVAVDLTRRGWLTWNVEYRRIGGGGGWPASGHDVVSALDFLAGVPGVRDDGGLVVIGHSAGAQLGLWAAGQRPEHVTRVVGLAGLCDLDAARRQRVGGDAVDRLLDGERASLASPVDQVPLGVDTLLVHATDDPLVPVGQSRRYAEAARAAGDPVELVETEGSDHFDLIDPVGGWAGVARRLDDGS